MTQKEEAEVWRLSRWAREIVESWVPGQWPPAAPVPMLLMQLATQLGRLGAPDWRPAGVNEPIEGFDFPSQGREP